jgi:hypothetical protein
MNAYIFGIKPRVQLQARPVLRHVVLIVNIRFQCYATFLHSRHTKYCRRVIAAHQPHFAYCKGGGEMVYGIDWPRQLLINRPQPENVLFDVHN